MSITDFGKRRIKNIVQTALVIRGLDIRGFDYTQTVKRVIIADNEGKFTILTIFRPKIRDSVSADRNFSRMHFPRNEGRLYTRSRKIHT